MYMFTCVAVRETFICTCLHVCEGACTYVNLFMKTGSQCHVSFLIILFFETKSPIEPGAPQLSRLDGQQAPRSLRPPLPVLRLKVHTMTLSTQYEQWGIRTRIPWLVCQVPMAEPSPQTSLSSLPVSSCPHEVSCHVYLCSLP